MLLWKVDEIKIVMKLYYIQDTTYKTLLKLSQSVIVLKIFSIIKIFIFQKKI